MVYLNRIYTKTGDGGQTSLGNGQRVAKTHARIVAYGTVDELNSSIGVAIAFGQLEVNQADRLRHVQNNLFDLGADLCVPEVADDAASARLSITPEQVEALERWIDEDTSVLEPLKSFVLPGGSGASALLHVARTICRRAEIETLRLQELDPPHQHVNPLVLIYLNRLSDLLFVMARMSNESGRADILWKPGK